MEMKCSEEEIENERIAEGGTTPEVHPASHAIMSLTQKVKNKIGDPERVCGMWVALYVWVSVFMFVWVVGGLGEWVGGLNESREWPEAKARKRA